MPTSNNILFKKMHNTNIRFKMKRVSGSEINTQTQNMPPVKVRNKYKPLAKKKRRASKLFRN